MLATSKATYTEIYFIQSEMWLGKVARFGCDLCFPLLMFFVCWAVGFVGFNWNLMLVIEILFGLTSQ